MVEGLRKVQAVVDDGPPNLESELMLFVAESRDPGEVLLEAVGVQRVIFDIPIPDPVVAVRAFLNSRDTLKGEGTVSEDDSLASVWPADGSGTWNRTGPLSRSETGNRP